MINGKACPVGRVVRINGKGGHDCIKGAPHFDKEGSVCGNDGKSNQAYCSYQVGDKACAYCSSTENKKHDSGSGKSSGSSDVCIAYFWDNQVMSESSTKKLDDVVVVVAAGTDVQVPKGQKLELGTVVAEEGAWMTISDGAFVTIDTDQLDCGLQGCSGTSNPKKASNDQELGYDRISGKVVSCDEEHDHKQPKPSSKPGSKPKLKLCPYKFFEENVFDKGGNWYCLVGDKVADNLKSESSCKYYKGNWQKTPPLKCGDAGAYFQARGEFDSKSVHDHFNKRCCVAQPKATPKPTPKPKPKAKCPSTCNHKTCDHWVKEVSFTCKSLEAGYGCDCSGCACETDKKEDKCQANKCFKKTCPEWQGQDGVSCETLKTFFGCSCDGCDCAKTVHKCGSPEFKGDKHCDDDNNIKSCNWDGGDCCHLDKDPPKQFVHCQDCKCLDPNGVKPKRACRLPKYQGDKYCDDANNVPSCNWDGGDCCAKDGKHVETKYCRECLCKDPNHKGSRCLDGHKKDGFCDDVNNVPECNYDDGDCCNNGHSGQFRYCKECECKDKTHHKKGAQCQGKCGSTKHKGDKFCDDDNNSCGCGWDGGDCCGHNGNNNQFEFCFKCKCLDSKFKAPDCAVAKYKGDGICDDHNNVKKCDWDGGDCCKQSKPNPKQFHYCKRCKCDHKKY